MILVPRTERSSIFRETKMTIFLISKNIHDEIKTSLMISKLTC